VKTKSVGFLTPTFTPLEEHPERIVRGDYSADIFFMSGVQLYRDFVVPLPRTPATSELYGAAMSRRCWILACRIENLLASKAVANCNVRHSERIAAKTDGAGARTVFWFLTAFWRRFP
jgi:hypothetical protein